MSLDRFAIPVICLGLLAGGASFAKWLELVRLGKAPLMTGEVVARTTARNIYGPVADFSIRIEGTDVLVHAQAPVKKKDQIPNVVRFHYSGDPSRKVILEGREGKPLLVALLFWGFSLVLIVGLPIRKKYRVPDDSKPDSEPPETK